MGIGTLVYHLLQVSQYSVQELFEIDGYEAAKGPKLNPIGLALNPSFGLINHSCDPNAIR